MRFALASSVALNLLLLTTIVAARIDPRRGDVLPVEATASFALQPMPEDSQAVASAADLLGILEGTGLGSGEIKALVLGWLEARHRGAYGPSGARYWEEGYSPGRDALAAEHAAESAVRAALVELFGAAAATDPAFDAVFRPLGPAYAFLGSRAQLALEKRQLELIAGIPARRDEAAGRALLCRAEDVSAAGGPPRAPLPPADLTEEEDTEYRLRFSPLAAQLRDAGIADDEAEFRDLFALVGRLEQRMAPAEQAELRAGLRARLGDARFDRFWSMRDPIFAAVSEYLAREGVPEHLASAAYSIVNRSQEALLSALDTRGDQASIVAAGRRVAQDETAALGRLLGAETAEGLRAALSEISLRLSQGSASGC